MPSRWFLDGFRSQIVITINYWILFTYDEILIYLQIYSYFKHNMH